MVMGKKLILLFILIFTASLSFAKVTAQADRLELYDDESFILTISVSPSGQLSRDDISALESIFTILTRRQSTESTSVNGQGISVTRYQFRLAPKEFGLLGLPAFTVNNEQSEPFFITVKDSRTRTNDLAPDAIEYSIDVSNTTPYVDQTITLNIEIAYRVALSGQFSNIDLSSFDVSSDSDQQSVETRHGKSYNIYNRTITLTPRKAGEYVLPDISFLGQYQISSTQAAKRITLNAKPPKITVKPIPAEYPAGAYWLPSDELKLEDNLGQSISLQDGEHLSWSITQTVRGLSANLLPDPLTAIENNSNFQLYRDNPIFKDSKPYGTRKDITALSVQANAGSTITLPKISIPWWNLKTDKLEYASLPSRTITITASNNQSATPVRPKIETIQSLESTDQSTIWPWVSLVLAISLAISLGYILFLIKRPLTPKQKTTNQSTTSTKIKLSSVDEAYPILIRLAHKQHSSIAELKSALPSTLLQNLVNIETQYYGEISRSDCTLGEAQLLVDKAQKIFSRNRNKDKLDLSIYPSD